MSKRVFTVTNCTGEELTFKITRIMKDGSAVYFHMIRKDDNGKERTMSRFVYHNRLKWTEYFDGEIHQSIAEGEDYNYHLRQNAHTAELYKKVREYAPEEGWWTA